jgi:hypothetical protein
MLRTRFAVFGASLLNNRIMNKKGIIVSLIGAVIGAVAGYLYYSQVGCITGSCAITSNPFSSTGYGALMGGLLFSMFIKDKKEATSEA